MKPPRRMMACTGLALALIWLGVPVGAWAAPSFAPRAQEASGPAHPQAVNLGWATQVSAGGSHTCAVTLAGGVKCWGNNDSGQLGDGTTRDRGAPVAVLGLAEKVVMISAGGSHTCAVTVSGGVKCWGNNAAGQLGDGTTTPHWTPIDVIGLGAEIVAVSAGSAHTCAVTTSGALKCWGINDYGQLGDGTTSNRSAPIAVVGLAGGVQMVSTGLLHTCVITASGGVKCWGENQSGALGDGTWTQRLTPVDVVGLSNGARAVSAEFQDTCAVLDSGGVKCWGTNDYYPLNNGNWHTPVDVVELGHDVRAVSNGGYPTCVLTMEGGVKCWGENANGSVGDGTWVDREIPVSVVGLTTGVQALDAGSRHTCAVLADGGVKCWGWNKYGQLGDGTTTNRPMPVDVWDLAYDCAAVTEIPAPECRALVMFFKATNGPLWQNHAGWLRTPTPCGWWGVACDAGHVSELVLPANNLVDTLPTALGDLVGLQRLDLHGNDLDGPLPVTLGNLSALQYLDLSAIGLAGDTIPPELGNLTALQTLDLHGNALAGPIPVQLGALTALQTLDLSANALNGPVPAKLTHLVKLRTLDLHANQLSGSLPADLGRLVAVQNIDLSHNAITGTLPASLGEAAALRTLDLSANQLSGPLPWTLSRLTALERLDLAHNTLTGALPPEWSLLSALQQLDLSYNALEGWLPPGYGQWTTLTHLDLSFNELRGTLPTAWGSLSRLETLSLNNNQLAGPIPAAWGTLGSAGPTAIRPATDPGSNAWWNPRPPGLYLDLSCNRLSGTIPVELARLRGLQALNLASNQLGGAVPDELLQPPPYVYVEDNLLNLRDPSQTVPPTDWRATLSAPDTVKLTWAPIPSYVSFYEISYATAPGGPFTVHGQTYPDSLTYTVTRLQPNVPYYFRARAFTPAHETQSPGWGDLFEHYYEQQSNLWSAYTPLVSVNVAATPTPTSTPTATPTPSATPSPALRVFLPLVWRGRTMDDRR